MFFLFVVQANKSWKLNCNYDYIWKIKKLFNYKYIWKTKSCIPRIIITNKVQKSMNTNKYKDLTWDMYLKIKIKKNIYITSHNYD